MSNRLSFEEVVQRVRAELVTHVGEDRKIGRWVLVQAVYGVEAVQDRSNNNWYDRKVRDAISHLRDELLICTSSRSGGGYWLASSLNEVSGMSGELRSRGLKMIAQAGIMDKRAVERFGSQPDLFSGM